MCLCCVCNCFKSVKDVTIGFQILTLHFKNKSTFVTVADTSLQFKFEYTINFTIWLLFVWKDKRESGKNFIFFLASYTLVSFLKMTL
jgi:hypothetical protein